MQGEGSDIFEGAIRPSSSLAAITIAAHELKSPLVLMRQLALELSSGMLSPTETDKVTDQLIHVSEKALRLTTNVTKAETLQTSFFPLEPINPLSICEDVTSELAGMYQAHGRRILVRRQKTIRPVVANRDLLRRILLNFADNALHYSDQNSSVHMMASARQRENVVRLSVRDYGPAIDMNHWQRIRAALSSGTEPMSRRPESSGLGIYIASQFAHAMRGTIGVTRHHDGASFYVELPVSHQLSLL